MFAVNYRTYSEAFVVKAIELAIEHGLVDIDPGAGKKSFTQNGLSITTPKGEMIAYGSHEGGEYPGISVDITPSGEIIGLATCEVLVCEGKKLITRVFENADEDSPSHHIPHYGTALEISYA